VTIRLVMCRMSMVGVIVVVMLMLCVIVISVVLRIVRIVWSMRLVLMMGFFVLVVGRIAMARLGGLMARLNTPRIALRRKTGSQ